jgi:hypothetical protein
MREKIMKKTSILSTFFERLLEETFQGKKGERERKLTALEVK